VLAHNGKNPMGGIPLSAPPPPPSHTLSVASTDCSRAYFCSGVSSRLKWAYTLPADTGTEVTTDTDTGIWLWRWRVMLLLDYRQTHGPSTMVPPGSSTPPPSLQERAEKHSLQGLQVAACHLHEPMPPHLAARCWSVSGRGPAICQGHAGNSGVMGGAAVLVLLLLVGVAVVAVVLLSAAASCSPKGGCARAARVLSDSLERSTSCSVLWVCSLAGCGSATEIMALLLLLVLRRQSR
jgi:hypothetical protein